MCCCWEAWKRQLITQVVFCCWQAILYHKIFSASTRTQTELESYWTTCLTISQVTAPHLWWTPAGSKQAVLTVFAAKTRLWAAVGRVFSNRLRISVRRFQPYTQNTLLHAVEDVDICCLSFSRLTTSCSLCSVWNPAITNKAQSLPCWSCFDTYY